MIKEADLNGDGEVIENFFGKRCELIYHLD